MRITWLPDAELRPRHIAVGEFDGVHLGHREVIRGADTVLTFEPHPRAVVAPTSAPPLLTPLPVKADLIAALGVEELVVIPFDAQFAGRTAEDFIADVLVKRLGAHTVSVGENFRFGNRALGDVELLRRHDAFKTRVAPLVDFEGEVVSSSAIRRRLESGDVRAANALLGAPFQLRGTVVHGDRRGRTLGYPTANLVPPEGVVLPAHGVYASHAGVELDGELEWFPAATNVGVRPTFASHRGVLVEAYLLEFSRDIYGRELHLKFVERLRGERRFESVDALVEQMHLDVEDARRVWTNVWSQGRSSG